MELFQFLMDHFIIAADCDGSVSTTAREKLIEADDVQVLVAALLLLCPKAAPTTSSLTRDQQQVCAREVVRLCQVLPEPVVVEAIYPLLNRNNKRNGIPNYVTPVPQFVKKLLCAVVLREQGVGAVVDVLLYGMSDDRLEPYDNVVKLVAAIPVGVTEEEYMTAIGPQLVQIISRNAQESSSSQQNHHHRIVFACRMLDDLLRRSRMAAGQRVVHPLLWPLRLHSAASEKQLETAITVLHRMLCSSPTTRAICASSPILLDACVNRYFVGIFTLYCALRGSSVSYLKRPVREIVMTYFHNCPSALGLHALHIAMAHFTTGTEAGLSFGFSPGEGGGIICSTTNAMWTSGTLSVDQLAEAVVEVVASIPLDRDLACDFVVLVAENVLSRSNRGCEPTAAQSLHLLLLSKLSNNNTAALCRHLVRRCDKVLHLISQCFGFYEGDQDNNSDVEVATLREQGALDPEPVKLSLALLQMILECTPPTEMGQAALNRVECALRRTVQRSQHDNAPPDTLASQVSIALLAVGEMKRSMAQSTSDGKRGNESPTTLGKVLEELNSGVPALIGKALMDLRSVKLTPKGLENAIDREQVLHILITHVLHEDSFVFLAATNGLVDFAALHPGDAIAAITQRYRCAAAKEEEDVLKLADALTQIALRLGRSISLHLPVIMSALLYRTHFSQTSLVRSSALQCLGQVCGGLDLAVQQYGREVLDVVLDVLRLASDVLSQRAAVSCLRECVHCVGNGVQIVQWLPRIVDALSAVEYAVERTGDEVLRVHADALKSELEHIVSVGVYHN